MQTQEQMDFSFVFPNLFRSSFTYRTAICSTSRSSKSLLSHVSCHANSASRPTVNPATLPSKEQSLSRTPPFDPKTIYYTSLESNSFVLTYSNRRILVDPWLTSTLDFITPIFSTSIKPLLTPNKQPKNLKSPPEISDLLTPLPSLILISQALPDHLHVPTLKKVPKSIPIIASPSAIPVLNSLNFQSVTSLPPGETVAPFDSISVTATTGSVVGPPWKRPENGWLFTFTGDSKDSDETIRRVYIEPHGNHPEEILNGSLGRIHAVVTPVVRASLAPIGYDLVRGSSQALQLLKAVRPQVAVILMNHVSEMKGLLTLALRESGSPENFKKLVRAEGLNTKIVVPETLKAIQVIRVSHAGGREKGISLIH